MSQGQQSPSNQSNGQSKQGPAGDSVPGNVGLMTTEQLPEALHAWCMGTLSDADAQRLTALLKTDAHARRFYIQYMDLHAALQWQANEQAAGWAMPGVGLEADVESMPTSEQLLAEMLEQERQADEEAQRAALRLVGAQDKPKAAAKPKAWGLHDASQQDIGATPRLVIPGWLIGGLVAAMLALVIELGLPFWTQTERPEPVASQTNGSLDNGFERLPVESVAVATLVQSDDAVWGPEIQHAYHGMAIHNRTLSLVSGRAVIRFINETEVELHGPCKLQPMTGSEMRLVQGKVVGRCETPASKGFVVRTPNAQVVDLGTEFGVLVDEAMLSKVFVYKGEVKLIAPEASVSLKSGDTARVDPKAHLSVVPTDTLDFLPAFDLSAEALPIRPHYVGAIEAAKPVLYQRFEGVDATANSGNRWVVNTNTLVNAMGQGPVAALVGPMILSGDERNKAAIFDGNHLEYSEPLQAITKGDYAIEFWVRPGKAGLMPLVGLYAGDGNWGGVIEISDTFRYLHRSPAGKDIDMGDNVVSPVAPVVDEWQHVVAVREDQTIRLFVNGQLVGSSEAMDPLSPAPQLIVGGGDATTSPYTKKQAFIGQVDELAVYDHALSAADVAQHFRLVAGKDVSGAP